MRLNPFEMLVKYHKLTEELVELIPKGRQAEFRERVHNLVKEREKFPIGGRGSHWKAYRDNQRFEVTIRGQGTFEVRGVEVMAKELGWKLSTFRTKMALAKGFLQTVKETDQGDLLYTVSRLPNE